MNLNRNKLRVRANTRDSENIPISSALPHLEGAFAALRLCSSCSSSSSDSFAEKFIALVPMTIISNRLTTPLRIGMLSHLYLWVSVLYGRLSTFTLPDGLRTAIVMLFGERIITPSITAWPPIAKSIFLSPFLSWLLAGASVEAAAIDQFSTKCAVFLKNFTLYC